MITNSGLAKVRLMNFYQAMTNVQKFLEQEDLETLKLKDPAKLFGEKYKAFDEAVQPMRGNVTTEELLKLDELRDNLLIGLAGHLKVFTGYPEETKAIAAQQLLHILDKYGKSPQVKPQREETAIVSNLIQDLEAADAKAKLALIIADKWVDALKDANTKFETAYNARTQHNVQLLGVTKEKRIQLYNEFRHLVNTINALGTLNGETAYKRLMDNINAEVQQALLAERPDPKKPKDPKKPSDPKQPEGPKKPDGKKPEDPKKPDEKPKKPKDNDDIHLPEE